MPGEQKFEKFTSIGSYFSMGGVGSTTVNCPPESAFTDEVLAELSFYGGTQAEVTSGDTTVTDLETSMALWWRLASLTLNISASGIIDNSDPTPDRPWSYSTQVNYDGAPRPNKLGNASGGARILDCANQDVIDYRTFNSQDPGGAGSIDNYTHIVPFSDGEDDVPNLLAEFFTFVDFIPETELTSAGLWILSTRNKDYTDVIIEGDDPNQIVTRFVGSKTVQINLFGYPISFYASFFTINSNAGLQADTFDIEFVDYEQFVAE